MTLMKKIFLILSMIACTGLVGCEKLMNGNWRLWIENKSDEDVYFVIGLNIERGRYSPTTELPNNGDWAFLVKSGVRMPIDYHDKIRGYSDAPIGIFVISIEVMNSNTWDEIREGEMYLKKYEYTCGELPSSPDTAIVYP